MIQCWIRSGDGPAGDGWFQQNQHLQPDRVPIPWSAGEWPTSVLYKTEIGTCRGGGWKAMANVAKVAQWESFPASYWVGRIVSNKASFRSHTKVVYQTALGDALLSLAFTFTVHVQGFLGWAKNSWWNTLQWGNPGRLYLLKLSSGSYWWSLSQSWKQLRCSTGSSKWPCWQMSAENGS